MNEVKRKICMVGDFGVGKTSLTRRFVNNVFSDRYLTTVGVKIDTKQVRVQQSQEVLGVKLVIWDIAGEDTMTSINRSYMRGLSGYLLVADGTRPRTVETADYLQRRTQDIFGELPFALLINKADLVDEWAVSDDAVSDLDAKGWRVRKTSAKTGTNVEESFQWLAEKIVSSSQSS